MFGGKHVEKLAAQRKAEWWKKLEDDLKVEAMKIESMLGTGKEAGETKAIALGEGVEMEMVWCPPGTFMMGSPMEEIGRDRDETQHNVTLTKGFWLAKTEVTQKQWKSVMGNNPSINLGDDFPVEQVSWEDAQMFCLKAGLRLPTEAQWEYACRAGTERAYAGSRKLDEMGWNDGKVHFVGKKKPNAWGLYDMHGNVSEWCADWYGEYPSGAVTDPKGAASGRERVCRGGGYHSTEGHCRSAYRESFGPSSRFSDLGFRSASIPAAE
jgi:formylglycine-generating enzyme required for sulfatase activity